MKPGWRAVERCGLAAQRATDTEPAARFQSVEAVVDSAVSAEPAKFEAK